MRVGVLAGCLGRKDGGPETYERELIRGIAQLGSHHEYFIYTFEEAARDSLGPLPGNVSLRILWPRTRWVSLPVSLPLIMLHDTIDVLHACLYPPPICPAPLVFTMHDISPIARPDFFSPRVYRRLNPLIRRGLDRARIVICVSRHAAETTAAAAGIDPTRLRVVPHGVDPAFRAMPREAVAATLEQRLGIRGAYMLYVGKIMARKNIVRLLEAFARFVGATRAEVTLVLAGKRLYHTVEVDEAIERLGIGARVCELGYVPDDALPALYAGAIALTYVTLWEGFGLPVVEAMASGTPVIASNVSSLPEVAGDAAILVDPEDVNAIAQAMQSVYENPALRAELARRALAQAARFRWSHTAQATVSAYEEAAKPRRFPAKSLAGAA